jgi:hypothetical protein
MRRLDELLSHAAGRGSRVGPERLIEHLERRLRGEREQVVAGERRGSMVQVTERPAPKETRPSWKRPVAALAAFLLVAVLGTAVVVLTRGDDDAAEAGPIAVAQAFAEELRSGDVEAIRAMWGTGGSDALQFLEWQIGLEEKPRFTDCRITSSELGGGSNVLCTVIPDDDSFYSVLLGPDETMMTAVISADGRFTGTSWPPPEGLLEAEAEFREWVRATHPELEDRMYGDDYGGLKMTRESGELRMEYLDEYLEYLDSN